MARMVGVPRVLCTSRKPQRTASSEPILNVGRGLFITLTPTQAIDARPGRCQLAASDERRADPVTSWHLLQVPSRLRMHVSSTSTTPNYDQVASHTIHEPQYSTSTIATGCNVPNVSWSTIPALVSTALCMASLLI